MRAFVNFNKGEPSEENRDAELFYVDSHTLGLVAHSKEPLFCDKEVVQKDKNCTYSFLVKSQHLHGLDIWISQATKRETIMWERNYVDYELTAA